jgi:hypothetical protein
MPGTKKEPKRYYFTRAHLQEKLDQLVSDIQSLEDSNMTNTMTTIHYGWIDRLSAVTNCMLTEKDPR